MWYDDRIGGLEQGHLKLGQVSHLSCPNTFVIVSTIDNNHQHIRGPCVLFHQDIYF